MNDRTTGKSVVDGARALTLGRRCMATEVPLADWAEAPPADGEASLAGLECVVAEEDTAETGALAAATARVASAVAVAAAMAPVKQGLEFAEAVKKAAAAPAWAVAAVKVAAAATAQVEKVLVEVAVRLQRIAPCGAAAEEAGGAGKAAAACA